MKISKLCMLVGLVISLFVIGCGNNQEEVYVEQQNKDKQTTEQIEMSDSIESSTPTEEDTKRDVTALSGEEGFKKLFNEYDSYRDTDMEIDLDLSALGVVANDIWKNNGTSEDLAKYLQNKGVTEIYKKWHDTESVPFNFDEIANRKYIDENEDGSFCIRPKELTECSLDSEFNPMTYIQYKFNGNGKLYDYTIKLQNPSDEAKKSLTELTAQLIQMTDTSNQIYASQYHKDLFSKGDIMITFWLGPESDKAHEEVDKAAYLDISIYDKEIHIHFNRTYYVHTDAEQ